MKTNTMETGFRNVATRIDSAHANFAGTISAISGCSIEQAEKVTALYLKLKVAKHDYVNGVINVKHGAFLEEATIKNALAKI